MNPALFNPMNVRKIPMPAAAAILISVGIALAIDSRIGVTEITRKNAPAQKIIPSAVGHDTPLPRMIVYVKKALMPMPGATANGSFAYKPHQQSHSETDEHRRRQHAAERHPGFAISGDNLRIAAD